MTVDQERGPLDQARMQPGHRGRQPGEDEALPAGGVAFGRADAVS